MPVSSSGIKNRFFRIYDGASPERHYIQFYQLDQPSLPAKEPRPTTGIQPDGGRMTEFATTFVEDETVPFAPIEATLRVMHMSQALELANVGNWMERASWTVGGHSWVGLATNAIGTRKNSDGVSIPCLIPQDIPQQTRMLSLVEGILVPGDAPSGTPYFCEWKGIVVKNAQSVAEGQMMYFDLTIDIWGEINPNLTDWPDGIESTPS